MMRNSSVRFYGVSSVFGAVALSLLTSCSYAPGMRVSGVLNMKPQQKVLTSSNDGSIGSHGVNVNQSQTDQSQTKSLPTRFTTPSGVNVVFQNLRQDNIPKIPEVSNAYRQNIRHLLRHAKASDYRVTTGDAISVNLWAYPELFSTNANASNFTVSQTGYIFLPMIGRVKAKGKTQSQLRNEISRRYARYLKQPDVDLKITNFNGRFYSVQGKVKKSGEFVIGERPATLMTALSQAGGLSERADAHKVTLNRQGKNYQFGLPELRAMGVSTSDIFLQNGDTLHIGSNANRKVYLIGEVNKSTYLTIPEDGLSLANALGESQGISGTTANPAKIYIVRDQQQQKVTQIYRLDLSQLENLALANDFKMLPNDMVYVDATGLTRWNRVLTQILSSANAIRTGQVIGNN